MELLDEDKYRLRDELLIEFSGKLDGSRKNILLEHCPFCYHDGYKYGIYIGVGNKYKVFGSSHCFHCGRSFRTLSDTLKALGRPDLIPKATTDLTDDNIDELELFEDDEIDDSLIEVSMPKGYKRCYNNDYLESRGWEVDDYQYFEAGTNRCIERKFEDYVILPIKDNDMYCGYVARHIWNKEDIDRYNETHRFKIKRYDNSTENGFAKLLYNYDAIIPHVTDTVILCEGAFDVVGLTRKMELYDNKRIAAVATFGKKISEVQLYKLQSKGVKTVVIGYDADAKETIKKIAQVLDQYFDTYVADISGKDGKDWDEMPIEDIYDTFSENLKTVREFNLYE